MPTSLIIQASILKSRYLVRKTLNQVLLFLIQKLKYKNKTLLTIIHKSKVRNNIISLTNPTTLLLKCLKEVQIKHSKWH